ncbi:MAG: HAD hydrolase-like protein [Clostridia bacterium]|nr:HAD hydrolase-like protein [Clostridia bacterium]
MIKAYVFDMDGTLLDTLGDLHAAVNRTLALYGLEPIGAQQTRQFVGNGIAMLARRACGGRLDPERLREFTGALARDYAANCEINTRPYDGIVPVLDELGGRGAVLATVTNKQQDAAESVARKYFGGRLRLVIGDNGVRRLKPAPDGVLEVMKALELRPDEVVFAGDGETDVKTGLAAGVRTIACLWGFRSAEQLRAAGATEFASSPEELGKIG